MRQIVGYTRIIILIVFLGGITGLQPAVGMPLNTILVTTAVDEYDDIGSGTGCSLREAITSANTDTGFGGCQAGSGTDIIQVPAGTYQLGITGAGDDTNATGDLDVTTDDLTITGQGTGAVIQANSIDRVLDIQSMATVVLNHLTITGGSLPATTTGLTGESGGGIRNAGTLTLNYVTVSNNHAGDVNYDIYEQRTKAGSGGGIASSGSLTITNSQIADNHAGDGNNMYEYGASGGDGGGIIVTAGSLLITNSTITGNVAGESKATQGGQGGNGGGIYINGLSASITASTISQNIGGKSYRDYGGSGGGIFAVTEFNLFISTVSGNISGKGGDTYGGPGSGCGIYADSNAIIRYSTIYNNSSATGSLSSQSNGGGILAMEFTLGGSIVAGNTTWMNIYPNIWGTGHSEDYNLIGITYGWAFADGPTGNSYLNVTDYAMQPLDDYGGPTMTHAILSSNLAVDKIPEGTLGCGTTYTSDQRGYNRPADGNDDGTTGCDIGAFETFINTPPVAVADAYSTGINLPLSVDAANGLLANDTDVNGGPLEAELVSGPNPGQGTLSLATDGSFTFTPAGGFTGDATFTYRADDGVGGFSAATLVTIEVKKIYLFLPVILRP